MADQVQNTGDSGNPSTRLDGADWMSFGVTTFLVLTGYLLTISPEVTLENSGVLTAGAMYGGVGSPGGAPVWTIYAWCFIKLLPISNPAWRVAVGSAMAGAVASGLVALIVSHTGGILYREMPAFARFSERELRVIRGISGYVAGMALGFSGGLWGEALIADCVTFTVLLFVVTLYLLMRWWETKRRRFCWLIFFVLGLCLTNSQELTTVLPGIVCAILLIEPKLGRDICIVVLPLTILATAFMQFAVWQLGQFVDWPLAAVFAATMALGTAATIKMRSFGSEWKSALLCGLFFILGLAPYLYLPIVAATNPPVDWAYARTWEGFMHLISRRQFERVHPVTSLTTAVGQWWWLAVQTGYRFGWLYLVFAVLPLGFIRRMSGDGRKWILGLLIISLCVGPLLSALLNMGSDRQSQAVVAHFFFPLRALLALWAGAGVMLVAAKMAGVRRNEMAGENKAID